MLTDSKSKESRRVWIVNMGQIEQDTVLSGNLIHVTDLGSCA